MNKERILALADTIEKAANVVPTRYTNDKLIPLDSFDMGTFKCGTAGCICGWALQVYDPGRIGEIMDNPGPFDRAQEWVEAGAEVLGISVDQGHVLFMPEDYIMDYVTAHDAAQALRHLAATGEVNWSHVDMEYDDE